MAVASDEAHKICTHCERDIPAANIDLHYAHCIRNLAKCEVCGDMVPKKHAEEHYADNHAPVSCSLCSETMERDTLAIHKGEICPNRLVNCEFCEFPSYAVDLADHLKDCRNRTDYCSQCQTYVIRKERYNHEASCNVVSDNTVGPSRDVREAERGQGPQRRRQPNEFSRRGLVFTVALTGIAVLLGSLFFQKKTEGSQVN
ncbi:uncharacterized protein LOC126796362 [Argentina anserina]|uniref:uncharacterized protein LOC126796362 n=1 Tax=Argentina anserina TaxID=57926 RepID=UPI00217639FA|nr:uncharacterized protein LOC126796362 [Potentilla anserina]